MLFFAVVACSAASSISEGSTPIPVGASAQLPDHLVLHGMRFKDKNGALDQGSKELLDYAAELLKTNPDMMVSISEHREDHSSGACGLSPVQSQAIASYIEQRGIASNRLNLCQTDFPTQTEHGIPGSV
jgi:hypothetical protein